MHKKLLEIWENHSLKRLLRLWLNQSRVPAGNAYLKMSPYSYGSPRILHYGERGNVRIGVFCSIADSVTIIQGSEHRLDRVTTFPIVTEGSVLSKGDIGQFE